VKFCKNFFPSLREKKVLSHHLLGEYLHSLFFSTLSLFIFSPFFSPPPFLIRSQPKEMGLYLFLFFRSFFFFSPPWLVFTQTFFFLLVLFHLLFFFLRVFFFFVFNSGKSPPSPLCLFFPPPPLSKCKKLFFLLDQVW